MATMEDLQDVLTSVDTSMKEQTSILKSMFLLQLNEAAQAAAERDRLRADRDILPPGPPGGPTPGGPGGRGRGGWPNPDQNQNNNTLSGLLGGLTALFGAELLGKFSALATGAAALAVTIGTTIGVISGQMKAIDTYFKLFGVDFPKIFDDFKSNITTRFTAIADDLKIRAAFIKVSVTEAFDNFGKNIKSLFSVSDDSSFSKIMENIKSGLNTFIEPFKTALVTIQELAGVDGSPGRISRLLTTIGAWFSEIGSRIARIASVVGKIFAPIAIIMTAFDTVKGALDGYAEGGILGGFQGAIDGFFTSLVTIPLDLIKDMSAWVLKKLGFDESAEALKSFSFTDLWKQMTGAIFDGIKSAWESIKESFSFGEEDKTALGLLGKLTDIVYAPVNMAINFVRGLFGFDESKEPFKLQDWIVEKANEIFDWVKNLFSFIPSIDEVKRKMYEALPAWLQKLIGEDDLGEPESLQSSLTRQIESLEAERANALISAGEFGETADTVEIDKQLDILKNQLDALINSPDEPQQIPEIIPRTADTEEDLAAAIKKIEESNMPQAQPLVVQNAPITVAPQISRGGNNQTTTITSYGGSGNSDLAYGAIPGGVSKLD